MMPTIWGARQLKYVLTAGIALCAVAAVRAQSPTTHPTTRPAATQPSGGEKRVEYAPHVTIDWSVPSVEIDARVVLREGFLELVVCTPQTKEHESILVSPARPRRVLEAMGLIGIEPGGPMMYDPDADRYTAASGQRLALEIHYQKGPAKVQVAAHEWLATAGTNAPIEPPTWIFCGSRFAGDRFGADSEGTVVCVVDFDTALIGLAERHSASNDELWLVADTSDVPPLDTECKLVISALDERPIVLHLTPEGYFVWNDEILGPLDLDALIKRRILHNPDQKIELTPMDGAPNLFARVAGRAIIGSGIAAQNLTLHLRDEPDDQASDASSPAVPPEETPKPQEEAPPSPLPTGKATPTTPKKIPTTPPAASSGGGDDRH